MTAEGVFPKVANDLLYASEVNNFNTTSGALSAISGVVSSLNLANGRHYVTVSTAAPAHYVGSSWQVIQSGVNHALASGLVLFVASGNYYISNPIHIEGPLHMTGVGPEYTVFNLMSGLNNYGFRINGSHVNTHYRTILENFQINGNCGSSTGITVNQNAGGGIVSFGGTEGVYNSLHFTLCYNYGLHLYDITGPNGEYGHHNRIHQCLFDQGEQSFGSGGGIYMKNNDENEINLCEFQYNKVGINDETGFNTIQACSFVDGGEGVKLLDCSRTRVVNNVFDYVGEHGVHLKGSFNTVSNNTFYNNGSGTNNNYDCIYIDYYGSNVINGNVFLQGTSTNRARSAIKEDGTSGTAATTYGYNMISNNYIMSVSSASATAMQGSFNWGTGSIIQTWPNYLSNNQYRQ